MSKVFTYEDLEANKDRENLLLTISGKVYNVSSFLDEHPGGDEVLIEEGGRDATEAFEDVGHSDEARALLAKLLVGTLAAGENEKAKRAHSAALAAGKKAGGSGPIIFVVIAALAAFLAWRVLGA